MNLLDDTQIQVQASFSPEQSFAMLNADARKVCSSLPREFFSLILTSPPYNIGKQYEQQTTLSQYLDTQTQIIKQLVPLLAPTGSLC